MFMRPAIALLTAACLLGAGRVSGAADVPVPGDMVSLRAKLGRERLVLRLSDPSIPLPAPNGPDDPASTAGLVLSLFGGGIAPETAVLAVSPGFGNPGWVPQTRSGYRYRNSEAPAGPSVLRTVRLREGKGIQLIARETGLTLYGSRGSVGVRIEMGSLRVCALFAGSSVQRDEVGRFTARRSVGLSDCSDQSLSGVACGSTAGTCGGFCPPDAECAGFFGLDCTCISSLQPCGDTAPACNGECPSGEVCSDVGGIPYTGCACLPAGSTGCGTVFPSCGEGDCPAGLTCVTDYFVCCGGAIFYNCACLSSPPPPPCGGPCPPGTICVGPALGFPQDCYPLPCSGGTGCPFGSTCEPIGGGELCIPIACSGGTGYPTCDGSCDPALTCHAYPQGAGACYCAS
jgi:hypothetical protein